ncbi:MAG: AsmA-like C-terminal region-containing protein [Candidatus Sulfotelmatobacter sp.]
MWIGVVATIFLMGSFIAVKVVIARAEPILRARVLQTLSSRFHGKVQLEGFGVSVGNGIQVTGNGLKVFGATDANPYEPGIQPIVSVPEFRFRTSLRSLFHWPMHIDTVYVDGLDLNIPPKGSRQEITSMREESSRAAIFFDQVDCENARLVINTLNPAKPPFEFTIKHLKLKNVGPGQAFQFDATLINPKPVGDIHSTGSFGPWQGDDPRQTPVQGHYSFTHADLSTIKGIAGMLSSTGEYSGTLGNIAVDGTTDTPDFRIATSGHPVPLHTEFHAIVDGTSGDTHLRPVNASFLQSSLTARGSVVRERTPHGHDIELDVVLDRARIQDLLRLGVRTEPPVMTGAVGMNTRLSIPPGNASVTDRLKLKGTFHVSDGHFANQKVQDKLDTISLISQGKPKEVHEHLQETIPTDLRGVFTLQDGLLSFSLLHFVIPGTRIDMTGVYTLDGQTFDFHGKVKLQATLSQMTTGWKSILLRPLDPFFRKDGAGTELPIKISGVESEPHFGLDFGHHNDHESAAAKKDVLSQGR